MSASTDLAAAPERQAPAPRGPRRQNSTLAAIRRPFRVVWRRLTSMRTALILLFLLAIAAVPGSILPQRPLNPDATTTWIVDHGWWGVFLDKLDMFDVFGAPWFAAIYMLLFISLIGCLTPRIRLHLRAIVRKPLPSPRNLDRLPESGRFEVVGSADDYARTARRALGRRWRIIRRVEPSGAITVSAEKGYLRETGNLLFHVAIVFGLILVAIGQLYKYQGTVVVTQGSGFCNRPFAFDSWKPGRLAADGRVKPAPFCINELNDFVAHYTKTGEPIKFDADVTYQRTVQSPTEHTKISVNWPLRIEGDRVYLISHGFSPSITVTMPDGSVRHDTQAFVPTDASTLLSEGAFKESGPPGKNADIGISAIFAPSPTQAANGLASTSPQVHDPLLDMFVYKGNLYPNGLPQSVYSLNSSQMSKIGQAQLRIGQSESFADGVTVRFDGWKPWVSFQVNHDPTQGWLLLVVVAMVAGLVASLSIRRRRVWLRITPAAGGDGPSPTVVSVGGLARSDTGNFSTEFAALLDRLRDAGTTERPSAVTAGKE